MSWILFKVNVLNAMITGRFSKDTDSFAEFYANEYDQCIKRGGDMLYGVNVINGNLSGMIDVIKGALKKGQEAFLPFIPEEVKEKTEIFNILSTVIKINGNPRE